VSPGLDFTVLCLWYGKAHFPPRACCCCCCCCSFSTFRSLLTIVAFAYCLPKLPLTHPAFESFSLLHRRECFRLRLGRFCLGHLFLRVRDTVKAWKAKRMTAFSRALVFQSRCLPLLWPHRGLVRTCVNALGGEGACLRNVKKCRKCCHSAGWPSYKVSKIPSLNDGGPSSIGRRCFRYVQALAVGGNWQLRRIYFEHGLNMGP
jgi:hypothetical protein